MGRPLAGRPRFPEDAAVRRRRGTDRFTERKADTVNPSTKTLVAAAAAATPLLVQPAAAGTLTPLEALGKDAFFDDSLSIPNHHQACASCHDPAKGGILPNSTINATTVVAPGAAPHALGNLKPPMNAYAFFVPPFTKIPGFPLLPGWAGGNFWDGRAEGCGKSAAVPDPSCPVANPAGGVSETVKWSDLPARFQNTSPSGYVQFLGPTADQALNPFPNDVEQNTREKAVCQQVKTAKYKDLYQQAYGEPINCNTQGNPSPTHISFKRVAVAIAAWQGSADLSSFTSKRDNALKDKPDHKFPLQGVDGWTAQEDLGHDLFYGRNDSGQNSAGHTGNCSICHNGTPGELPSFTPKDPTGVDPHQLYADSRYHHIGVPFNRSIPGVAKGEKVGLKAHVTSEDPGFFKTPILRNVGKGASASFTKAYAHNGYFKSLKQIVHFYNTRDARPKCEDPPINIVNATAAEAIAHDCWPRPEFPNPVGGFIGDQHLSPEEEDAIVAYLNTLSDTFTPAPPASAKKGAR
jgi:cytochrome c peroxidase